MLATPALNLVDAGISELSNALDSKAITSVELCSLYLHRIGKYDCRAPCLNSICVLNPQVLEEAKASDDYRASGRPPRPLEGIPYTVKDSFRVKDMAVAAGSPAFEDLIAPEDAAIVKSLREAGAIVLGRTNMPPMADGGSQRGLYGRAESPYNLFYSTTAYASGSSNGSGTSTSASFAAFGFASETVSSGRSPASNNALVGYSPSPGVIPNGGLWPLYPTCDVIVPHTRSMTDLFHVLNVIVADDTEESVGHDFWRNQKFIQIPKASEVRPADFRSLEDATSLQGKRIAVPRCFLGVKDCHPFHLCSNSVLDLWGEACADLESLGATIVETDFPMLEQYTKQDFPGQGANVPGMTREWMATERCEMIATAWDDFLREQGDKKHPNFAAVDPEKIHPLVAPMDDPSAHSEAQNQVRYPEMMDAVRERTGTIFDLPGCDEALRALETMRKQQYEAWMDANGYDLVAFPTNGDVPFADADETLESMLHALQHGIKYANGGRALKHLGIPCVTVPMGNMADKKMPVGITFCSKAWDDSHLLRSAFAYEVGSRKRIAPPLTPSLPTDKIICAPNEGGASRGLAPELTIDSTSVKKEAHDSDEVRLVSASGVVTIKDPAVHISSVTAHANGEPLDGVSLEGDRWTLKARLSYRKQSERFPTMATVPKDQFMVVVVAKASNGRCAAKLVMID